MPKTLRIQGVEKVLGQLRSLELSLRRQALESAAEAGAEIIRVDAANRAPIETGRLARGMTKEVSPRSTDMDVTVNVGPSKEQFYGTFVELGTIYEPPHPFLKPALEANRENAQKKMHVILWDAIRRVVS